MVEPVHLKRPSGHFTDGKAEVQRGRSQREPKGGRNNPGPLAVALVKGQNELVEISFPGIEGFGEGRGNTALSHPHSTSCFQVLFQRGKLRHREMCPRKKAVGASSLVGSAGL